MRKLKCYQSLAMCVEEVVEEFSERMEEFGIAESDVVSVSAFPPTSSIKIGTPTGTATPRVEVAIVYWVKD